MGISNLKARSGGQRRGGNSAPRKAHMFGQVVSYQLDDKTGMKSNPEKDTMTIALFRDALGIKAEQAEDGTLLTQVTVKLQPPEKKAGSAYEPLTIKDMKKGRGSAKVTKVGDFVMFKDVEKVGDAFVARRVEGAIRDFNPEQHAPFSGLFSVRRESYRDIQGSNGAERMYYQYRVGALVDAAQPVATVEELREEAINALAYAEQMHGADPQFVVRAIVTTPEGEFVEAASVEVNRGWDDVNKVVMDHEQTVDRWLASDEGGKAWVEQILASVNGRDENGAPVQLPDEKGNFFQFEVIPQFRVRTGRASMPWARKQDKEANNKTYDERQVDDRVDYMIRGEGGSWISGYMASDVILNRVKNDDGSFSRTHTIFTQPQRQYLPRLAQEEMITPNISEKLRQTFEQRGDEAAREAFKARQAPAQTEEQHEEDNQEMSGMAP